MFTNWKIEMRAVIFYYCKQNKEMKKIHHKPYDGYSKASYSLSALKYWVGEFKVQRLTLMMKFDPGDS
jgi:hypothetical protein